MFTKTTWSKGYSFTLEVSKAIYRPRIWWFCLFIGLMVLLPARADDLLDPSKIGSVRKSVDADGLLSLPGTTPPETKTAPPIQRRSPSYARGMAGSVVSSLNGLTQTAAELIEDVSKLDDKIHELTHELRMQRLDMVTKMREYRQGLFCSGCNKTRSEILAKGQTFPHEGQEIVKLTPAELDAKESDLQAPIDQLDAQLHQLCDKRLKVANERDEALLQIGYGFNLWRTSISFEDLLLWRDENESAAANKAEHTKNDEQIREYAMQIHQLRMKMLTDTGSTPSAQYTAAITDLNQKNSVLTTTQNKLDQQRTVDRHSNQDAVLSAATTVQNELSTLSDYARRGQLPHQLVATPNSTFVSGGLNFNELGGYYRMGSYSSALHDEVLPNVSRFLDDFHNSLRDKLRKTGNSNGWLPPSDSSSTEQLKNKMKELLKSAPTGDEQPAPRKNSGTGIRG